MSVKNKKVVEFPSASEELRTSDKTVSMSVVMVTAHENDASIVKYILNSTGRSRTKVVSSSIDKLSNVFKRVQGDIVIVCDRSLRKNARYLHRLFKQIPEYTPVLILSDKIDEQSIDEYLVAGARDVLSLEYPKHFRSAVVREFGSLLVYRKLMRAQRLCKNYERQVKRFTRDSSDGIADVRDGCIVGANTSWLNIFECDDSRQLLNTPILDLVKKSDQAKVKQAIADRLTGENRRDVFKITGRSMHGKEFPLSLVLERIRINGSPTMRVTARPDALPSVGSISGIDESTQIYDRKYFLNELGRRLAVPLMGGTRSLIYIRPDRFSSVQNSIGILGSEAALAHIASTLREMAHPDDLFGRLGGTVFCILLERGSVRDAEAWVRHFCDVLGERAFKFEGNTVELTCSAGLSEINNSEVSIDKLLQEAHGACHIGRLSGGNDVQLGASSKKAQIHRNYSKQEAEKIRLALRQNDFRLIRTPIIKLDDSDCKLRDACVRMLDADGNDILPADFMPIAEDYGLMTMIDRWVIGASLTYSAKRQPDVIFVRLSQDSIHDDTLPEWVRRVLEKSDAKPSQICFQTTEAIASQSMKQTRWQAQKLIDMGFNFAIDQFGTTSDTMNILQHVPLQYVRIDAALLQGLARDQRVKKQVSEIVRTARTHCIHTIGDRIEDAKTLAAACQIGIEYAQGDYVRHDEIVLEDTHTVCRPILPEIAAA